MINALAGLGWQPASHQVRSRRPSHESFRVEMGAEQDAIAAEYIRTSVDVSAAAAAVSSLLQEDEQRVSNVLDALFMRPPSIEGDDHDGDVHAHVWERDALVGEIPSSELLTLDEQAGIWPMSLESDTSVAQMAYVDEAECIGCTYCASIARSTFHMQEDAGGVARAVQQGECLDAIEEAQASCPVNCIHLVSRLELEELEEEREGGGCSRLDHFNDQVARTAKRLRVPDLGPSFPGIAQQAAMSSKWGSAAVAARADEQETYDAQGQMRAVAVVDADGGWSRRGHATRAVEEEGGGGEDADLARKFATLYEEEVYTLPSSHEAAHEEEYALDPSHLLE
jgi:ferredoxin